MTIHSQPAAIDSIKKSLVALKMPRALEILDTTLRRVEQGEVTWIEALDQLLIEELTLRDNRRVSTALRMSRLTTVKTLAGFDFAFQPSLDRNRILALAELKFIDRAEVVHLLGPPGTGKSHLATALAVEAVKAGKSVAFATLADIVTTLAKAEREGSLRERLRFLARASLLVVDEIGYLPVVPGGGNQGVAGGGGGGIFNALPLPDLVNPGTTNGLLPLGAASASTPASGPAAHPSAVAEKSVGLASPKPGTSQLSVVANSS